MNQIMRRVGLLAAIAAPALSAACGGDGRGPASGGLTVVDSAGVEIVTSPAPAWAPGEGWQVAEEPSLTIGSAEEDEAYALFGVVAAVRLPDGRIAIANAGTRQVRIYDASGRHVLDLGREGQGPGEFRRLADVWRGPGDSIVAADNALGRLTVFDAEARFGRTILLQPATPSQAFGRGTLDDGSLLVSLPGRPADPTAGLFDGGMRAFDRYSAEGRPLNPIGVVPQGPQWGFETNGSPAYAAAPLTIFSPPHATGGASVYLGDPTQPEVRQRSPDGTLLRIVRWGVEPRPVTPAIQQTYRDVSIESATTPEARRLVLGFLEQIVFPDHLPVYDVLRADPEGCLWVKPYATDWEADAPWWVFDPAGRWLGSVALPAGLTLLDVGPDYVLGTTRDELGVERVVLHALDRS